MTNVPCKVWIWLFFSFCGLCLWYLPNNISILTDKFFFHKNQYRQVLQHPFQLHWFKTVLFKTFSKRTRTCIRQSSNSFTSTNSPYSWKGLLTTQCKFADCPSCQWILICTQSLSLHPPSRIHEEVRTAFCKRNNIILIYMEIFIQEDYSSNISLFITVLIISSHFLYFEIKILDM